MPSAGGVRRQAGRAATVLAVVASAVAVWFIAPAHALPSFSGQTGAPCAACHVGGFGPILTPFGIQFKVNGYTMGGGTGPWAHMPFNLQFTPSLTNLGKDRPTAPAGFGANNFETVGCASFLFAAGRAFDNGSWGLGGIGKMWLNLTAVTSTHGTVTASIGPSDFKFTIPIALGNGQPLVLGFDVNNKATEGDPWDTALYGYSYPLSFLGSNAVSNNASPIVAGLGTSNVGTGVYAFWNNSLYASIGIYQTLSSSWISALGKTPPPSIGFIDGSAPFYRMAWQHSWGSNYLEVGGLYLDAPVSMIPGIANPALQNEFQDYGLDATYQRTFAGGSTLNVFANILHENQDRMASFDAGKASNPTDYLNQFRIACAYDWHSSYEAIFAYNAIFGSADPLLYPATALTGSANHSPDTQVFIAEVNWTPNGNTTSGGFPWWNVRIGLQYRYYAEFNGGTINYDGHGRNATDNNELLLYTMFSF